MSTRPDPALVNKHRPGTCQQAPTRHMSTSTDLAHVNKHRPGTCQQAPTWHMSTNTDLSRFSTSATSSCSVSLMSSNSELQVCKFDNTLFIRYATVHCPPSLSCPKAATSAWLSCRQTNRPYAAMSTFVLASTFMLVTFIEQELSEDDGGTS